MLSLQPAKSPQTCRASNLRPKVFYLGAIAWVRTCRLPSSIYLCDVIAIRERNPKPQIEERFLGSAAFSSNDRPAIYCSSRPIYALPRRCLETVLEAIAPLQTMKSAIFLGRRHPALGSWPQCIGSLGEDREPEAINWAYFQGFYVRHNSVIPQDDEVYQLPGGGES